MNKNIVILEPNSAGIKLIDASLKLNNNVIVFTYNKKDRVLPRTYQDKCEIIEVDTNDEAKVLTKLERLNLAMPINAILPGFEYYVPLSAKLNKAFNLRGLNYSTADAMRFKHKMREHLLKAGLKMPKFIIVSTSEDISSKVDDIKFPCVIKPTHLAGSLHIKKINNKEELLSHFELLKKDQYEDLGYKMQGNIIIEDYIDGKEYSVEGFVNNNIINIISVTDKYLGKEPYFVEVGHITKSIADDNTKIILINYAQQVVKALDINLGPFHCEMRLTKQGPVLIEIASRLVGDNISEIIELSTGISLAEKMVKCYLGLDTENKDQSHFKNYAGVKFLYGKSGEKFNGIQGSDEIQKFKGFKRMKALLFMDELIPPLTDFRARIGEAVFTGDSYQEVKAQMDLAMQLSGSSV